MAKRKKNSKHSGPERRRYEREGKMPDRPVGAKADNVVKLGGVEIARKGDEYVRGKELQREVQDPEMPDKPDSQSLGHIKQTHLLA